jgi:geranylgeranyl diphosphate synthase, type I
VRGRFSAACDRFALGRPKTARTTLTVPAAFLGRRFSSVRAAVEQAVAEAAVPHSYRALLLGLLAERGHILAPGGLPRWPAFVVDTCLVLGGDRAAAAEAAGAVELVATAADILDDLVDGELIGGPGGPRSLNATQALVCLALGRALGLGARAGHQRGSLVARILAGGALAAQGGEDLDLLLERDLGVTEEAALEMTGRKSGNLVGMACQVGAVLATDEPRVLELVHAFGYRAGVVAQLLNDMLGVDVDPRLRGSDLRRRKKTLPVAYLLRCAREEGLDWVLDYYRRADPPTLADEQRIATMIHDLGGLHYTWVVADTWRHDALDALRSLAAHTGRDDVMRLRRLLPSVRARGFLARA